jgi:lactate permease
VSGGSFAIVQFLVSNHFGPTLVDVAGGLTSLAALAIMLRFWQPREIWRFAEEAGNLSPDNKIESMPKISTSPSPQHSLQGRGSSQYPTREVVAAWVPWVILSICVFLWGLPGFKAMLNRVSDPQWNVPGLHELVKPDAAVIGEEEPLVAKFEFNWLSATGTGILLAAVLSAAWMGISPYQFGRSFLHTVYRLRWSLFTIACMLAIAYTTKFSGSDVTLGLAFTRTGVLYPFFAPLLGWLGVALTGSDTSSNALFGNLQRITAKRLDLNPILICASNSTGGVMGKMIDAQSIVVASAATNQQGGEGRILRFVFWHSLVLAALMGLLTLAQAHWLQWMVPGS